MLGTLGITFAVFFGLQRYATDPEFFHQLGLADAGPTGVGRAGGERSGGRPPDVGIGPAGAISREAFERTLAGVAPERRFSRREIDRAQDALLRQLAARSALASLPADPANAERRRLLVDAIGRASNEFRARVGVDPLEFVARAEAEAEGPARGTGPRPGLLDGPAGR